MYKSVNVSDALQHIHEVDIGIDAMQPAGHQQTLDDTDLVRTEFGPAK